MHLGIRPGRLAYRHGSRPHLRVARCQPPCHGQRGIRILAGGEQDFVVRIAEFEKAAEIAFEICLVPGKRLEEAEKGLCALRLARHLRALRQKRPHRCNDDQVIATAARDGASEQGWKRG